MKTVIIADIQLHNHEQWSVPTKSGLNSRLLYGIESLKQAATAADGGTLIVAGDFFHDSRAIDISVLFAASRWLAWARQKCKSIYIAAGNHDHYRKVGNVHSLEQFNGENVHVVEAFEHLQLHPGIPCFLAAYHHNIDDLRKELAEVSDSAICILHQSVKGATMNGGAIADSGLTIAELERFRLTLLGHFHRPQSLSPTIHYIGSPYQIDKGEMGETKRFAIIENGQLSWQKVTGIPEYKVVLYETFVSLDKKDIANHYWEVICSDDERSQLAERNVRANYRVIGQYDKPDQQQQDTPAGSITPEEAVKSELVKLNREDLIPKALERMKAPE